MAIGASAEERFEVLLDRFGRFLRNAIAGYSPRDIGLHIDDIEQDARIRLWQAIRSEKTIEDPASYIYRIAVTATIDAIRRVKARREDQFMVPGSEAGGAAAEVDMASSFPDPEPSPERQAEMAQTLRKVETCVSQLAVDRKRAVQLHLQGMNVLEVAVLENWSEARARNLIYRGLADLRALLRSEGIDYETRR